MKNDCELFICYSNYLKIFLLEEGIRFKVVGLNPDNKRMFWVFIKNEELNNALAKWRLVKDN